MRVFFLFFCFLVVLFFSGCGGESVEGSKCVSIFDCGEDYFCNDGVCSSYVRSWRAVVKSVVVVPESEYWDSEDNPPVLGADIRVDNDVVFEVPFADAGFTAEWGEDNVYEFEFNEDIRKISFFVNIEKGELGVPRGILDVHSYEYNMSQSFGRLFNQQDFIFSSDLVVKFEFSVEPI